MFEAYKEARFTGLKPADAARKVGVSVGMTTKYEKRLRDQLPNDIYATIQSPLSKIRTESERSVQSQKLSSENRNLKLHIRELKRENSKPLSPMSRTEVGVLGEDYAYYRLRRAGFEVFRPSVATSGTDLMILASTPLRIEVKSTYSRKHVSPKCMRRINGENQLTDYPEGVVDFFVFVNLATEHLFVVPFNVIPDGGSFALTPGGRIWPYKDRFDLLRK